MDVLRRLKRASHQKKVGHGGTLDPAATGVVPVCFGQATRLMSYVVDGDKEYVGTVELGVVTDSYDSEGEVVSTQPVPDLDTDAIQEYLLAFIGDIEQVPPMYSALKQDGKRLYDLARQGVTVERKPRKLKVYGIEIIDWQSPLLTIKVHCGKGFYMRSLAFDIGSTVGCGGYLKSLRRIRNGKFDIEDAIPLDEAEEIFESGDWASVLESPDSVIDHLPAVIVGKESEMLIRDGRPLPYRSSSGFGNTTGCRAYSVDGRFLAMMRFDIATKRWWPDKVFDIRYVNSEDIV